MPTYLILLIAVVIGVDRGRKRIVDVEGTGGPGPAPRSRRERWAQAGGRERAMFVMMGVSGLLWLLLILPIGFAAAVVALGLAVWKRPYLEATLAPVVVTGGVVLIAYDAVWQLARGDANWGAALVNSALFGGLWAVIGLLMLAAAPRAA